MSTFFQDPMHVVAAAIFVLVALIGWRLTRSFVIVIGSLIVGLGSLLIHTYLSNHVNVVGNFVMMVAGVVAVCLLYLKQGTLLWRDPSGQAKDTPAWQLWLLRIAAYIF